MHCSDGALSQVLSAYLCRGRPNIRWWYRQSIPLPDFCVVCFPAPVVLQKRYFKANWTKRGFVLVVLMTPKLFGPAFCAVPGLPNCGWFAMLKNSARNCNVWRSVILVVLIADKSKLTWPGPRRTPSPVLP